MPFKIVVEFRINPHLRWHSFMQDGVTRQAMSEELNAMASRATTQVRRHLAHQTSLPYGYMVQHVTLRRSSPGNLVAVIRVEDRATSLGRFMTSYTKRPKSWRKRGWQQKMRLRVWGGSQVFPKNSGAKPFVIDGGRTPPLIAVRRGKGSRAIKVLSGPVLAGGRRDTGEVQRLETKRYIDIEMPLAFSQAVDARIKRIIAAKAVRP